MESPATKIDWENPETKAQIREYLTAAIERHKALIDSCFKEHHPDHEGHKKEYKDETRFYGMFLAFHYQCECGEKLDITRDMVDKYDADF